MAHRRALSRCLSAVWDPSGCTRQSGGYAGGSCRSDEPLPAHTPHAAWTHGPGAHARRGAGVLPSPAAGTPAGGLCGPRGGACRYSAWSGRLRAATGARGTLIRGGRRPWMAPCVVGANVTLPPLAPGRARRDSSRQLLVCRTRARQLWASRRGRRALVEVQWHRQRRSRLPHISSRRALWPARARGRCLGKDYGLLRGWWAEVQPWDESASRTRCRQRRLARRRRHRVPRPLATSASVA